LKTPYKKVTNGRVQLEEEPVYLTAEEEEHKIIGQATTTMDNRAT